MAHTDPPAMHAREAGDSAGAGSVRRSRSSKLKPRLPTAIDAEVAAERILALLEKDLYLPARNLAAQAIERFPDHRRLNSIWKVFDTGGKSWIAPGGSEPSRREELEWLRHPPEWARGKWVALVGSDTVAVGDTLKEVTDSVRTQELAKQPLVHRVD